MEERVEPNFVIIIVVQKPAKATQWNNIDVSIQLPVISNVELNAVLSSLILPSDTSRRAC